MLADSTPTKRCSQCGKELPFTNEYFSRTTKSKSGLRSQCKHCQRAQNRTWRENNPTYLHDWYVAHQCEHATYGKRWAQRNRQKSNWIKKKWRQVHPEQNKACQSRYQRNNSLKVAVVRHKRRTLKHNLPFQFTANDWERCLSYWGDRCAICGRPVGLWHTLAQDHWIPLSDPRPDNPGTVPGNILPLCHAQKGGAGSCNVTKNAQDPIEWLMGTLGPSAARKKLKEINDYFDWTRKQQENPE